MLSTVTVLVKHDDDQYYKHKLIRKTTMLNDPKQYREQESRNTIDTLTSRVKAIDTEIKQLKEQLSLKTEQAGIMKSVLHNKLKDKMAELGFNRPDVPVMSNKDMMEEDSFNLDLLDNKHENKRPSVKNTNSKPKETVKDEG